MLNKVMSEVIQAKEDPTTFAERLQHDIKETQDRNLNEEIAFLIRHHITPIQLDRLSAEAYKGW